MPGVACPSQNCGRRPAALRAVTPATQLHRLPQSPAQAVVIGSSHAKALCRQTGLIQVTRRREWISTRSGASARMDLVLQQAAEGTQRAEAAGVADVEYVQECGCLAPEPGSQALRGGCAPSCVPYLRASSHSILCHQPAALHMVRTWCPVCCSRAVAGCCQVDESAPIQTVPAR
jgi:hypothetical protein